MIIRACTGLVVSCLVAACSAVTPASIDPVLSPSVAVPSVAVPSVAPAPTSTYFADALIYLTPEVSAISFTDWAHIKASLGASDINSSSPEEDQMQLLEGLLPPFRPDATPRPGKPPELVLDTYGTLFAQRHAEIWLFDIFDYEWSAALQMISGQLVYAIRLREGIDLASIKELFDERGYASETVGAFTLRTREFTETDEWFLDVPAQEMLNVAVLDEQRTLVLSTDADAVRQLLGTDPVSTSDHVLRTVEALGTPSAATLYVGSQWCESVQDFVARTRPESVSAINRVLASAGPLATWDTLAVGYSRQASSIGRFVLGYAEISNAQKDLAGRRMLAEQGVTIEDGDRYADRYFTVNNANADDGVIVIEATPVNDWPFWLFRPIFDGDAMHALCGEA